MNLFTDKMRDIQIPAILFLFMLLLNACKKDNGEAVHQQPIVLLPDIIRENRTLSSDTIYTFRSIVVTNHAVLTIQPGTIIRSSDITNGKSRSEYFAIDTGSKIMAAGTPEKPIVFTSGSPERLRQHGDWGGLYLAGRAPVSAYDPNTGEYLQKVALRGLAIQGGGDDPNDNSGVLQYVRIEFAGLGSSTSYGLGCLGVGAGTTIDHIECSYTQTCGFGFYGGNVNAHHLVAFNNKLTGFIYANGYTGKQQFLVSYKHPYFAAPGSFIYTCDGVFAFNDLDNFPLLLSTRPVISNLTVIGPNDNPGYNNALPWNASMNISNGSAFVLRNSILTAMPHGGIKISEDAAAQQVLNGNSEFSYNMVHSMIPEEAFTVDMNNVYSMDAAAFAEYGQEHHNENFLLPGDMRLSDPFNFKLPVLLPLPGSPALKGADFEGNDFDAFFQPVTYRGAFGAENWMQNWTNFYPITTQY